MSKTSTALLVAGYLLLRWILSADPGYIYDVLAYKRWAVAAAEFGISGVYEHSDCDYPPLYPYFLYPLGLIYKWVSPEAFTNWYAPGTYARNADSAFFTVLIKFPPLIMDLAMAAMLHRFSRWSRAVGWPRDLEAGPSGEAGTTSRWIRWLPVLYLMNPVVLFDGGYWGQPDSIHSFFVLAAFLALGWSRQAWIAWVLLALATLMKPLGAPFIPLLAVLSIARFGLVPSILGGLAGAATVVAAFLPFIVAGNVAGTLDRITGDAVLMAYTSTNAHNIWWLLGGWRDAESPWLGPLSATQVSLILFALFYLGILVKGHLLHRAKSTGITHPQMIGLAFLLGFGFFMLATHMHENHMFIAVPLALPLILWRGSVGKQFRYIFAAVTLGVFLNLALHDPDLSGLAPLTWGGDSSIENVHLGRPFAVFELWAIRFSMWWNLGLFGFVTYAGLKRDGWLDRLGW